MQSSAAARAGSELELRRRRSAAVVTGSKTRLSFLEHSHKVNPKFQAYRHTQVLARVLEDVAYGRRKRVMVFMPPRHGKSTQASVLFPSFYMRVNPDHHIGLASYGAHLAHRLSASARQNYLNAGGQLAPDSRSKSLWKTAAGGEMWAVGVGGPATGSGGHLLLGDDLTKDAQDARSQVVKASKEEWWDQVFSNRLEPDGAIVLVNTRWAIDDLPGWILSKEIGDDSSPEEWHIVMFPAIYEGPPSASAEPMFPDTCTLEPDWRQVGEALCPERYPVERLLRMKAKMSSYAWNALYGQYPVPRSGNMFKWDWFSAVDANPADVIVRVRAWDTAGTEDKAQMRGAAANSKKKGPDYTAGALLAIDKAGCTWIEDVVRGQWSPAQKNERILAVAQADRTRFGNVRIRIEKETGVDGGPRTQALVRALAGFTVEVEPAVKSKEERAEPLAAQAEVGNVRLVKGEWNTPFLTEMTDFPYGKHDDQVDAAASAYNKAAALIEELRKRRGFAMPGLMMTGV